MFSVQEMQRVDRELSLELTESQINPAFIHMSTTVVNGYDPLFYLQINGDSIIENILPAISQVIEGTEVYPVILGDSAFPFRVWLMKSYGNANLTPGEGYFNYRLSRARMITERAYGQLKSRWRVLYRKLECRPDSVKLAALAWIVLHNICITTKDSLPAQLDLSINPFTQKKRSREEIRDLLQMCNCPKRKDSSRKAGAIREALTRKMWQEKEANELEM